MNDMQLTLDQLVKAQKQIEWVFRRPVKGPPAPLDNVDIDRFVSSDAYRWGLKNVVGVAVSWPSPAEVQVFLDEQPIHDFAESLQRLFPGIPLRFRITGTFQFLAATAGVGADIKLHVVPAVGKVALFLKDTQGQFYALTCAHVLEGDSKQRPRVDSQGVRIGALTQRVNLIYGCVDGSTSAPNEVDCALAGLDATTTPNNALPMIGGKILGFATAQQNDPVVIINSTSQANGTVSLTHVNHCIFDKIARRFAYFDDLLLVTGAAGIGEGDSGTVVLSSDGCAVGLVIAASLSGDVLACDINMVISALESQFPPGTKLSLV